MNCTVRGPAENLALETFMGGFQRSVEEQMGGDSLGQIPSSLFILLGWNSV
jgi:hypothetical protein